MRNFFAFSLIVALCVASARGQESERPESLWNKIKTAVKEFVGELRGLWSELKEEIKAKTTDMREWTSDMFNDFKARMKEWVTSKEASEEDKNEMKNFIEKLQMPTDTPNNVE